ncbi:hypothetical protein Tco_0201644 [Tanacetum coccineum]
MFQRLGRYPTSACVFPDPILFLAGLQPLWEHGQQRHAIIVDGKEMAFRDFIYAENEEDLSFLPKEPSPGLGTGLPSMSVNTKPPSVDVEPLLKLFEDTTDFGGSPKPEVFVVHPGSVVSLMSSSSKMLMHVTLKFLLLLLQLRKSLGQSYGCGVKIRRECDVMEERERAQEEECEELRSKCEASMTNFEKNPCMVILSALKSKVASLEAEKARLEAVEASLKKEVDDVKHDRWRLFQRPIPSKTQVLVPSSQRAIPSSALASNLMSPHAAISSLKPQSSQS